MEDQNPPEQLSALNTFDSFVNQMLEDLKNRNQKMYSVFLMDNWNPDLGGRYYFERYAMIGDYGRFRVIPTCPSGLSEIATGLGWIQLYMSPPKDPDGS